MAEGFPEQAFGTVPMDGVAHALGGNESRAPHGRNPVGCGQEVYIKKSALPACSGSANCLKVSCCAQVLLPRVPHVCGPLDQSLNLWRPRARRALRTLRPPRVPLRARKPHLRALLSFEGLYVGCMMCFSLKKKGRQEGLFRGVSSRSVVKNAFLRH
jgi:hypothetical protein